ncbi:MAG: C-terminal binding protein [Thermoleophilia bacterium]|nr:C-terminal binding protein [Thermoleophilia bacterium]
MSPGPGPRLVILDAGFGDAAEEARAAEPFGVEVEDAQARTPEERGAVVASAEGVLVRFSPVDSELIARHPRWRVIGRYGVGVDNVDIQAATARGIAVINVPDYCVEEVATHALALMLASWRKLPQAERLIAEGRWNDWRVLEPVRLLSTCTLGLVGLGQIGGEVARLAQPLFGRIVAFDPSPIPLPAGVEEVELDRLFAEADIVSLHCPLTPETRHLADARRLDMMKPDSLLVNVSRGELVDTAALARALDVGRPARAALDVLPQEPPEPGDPLLGAPNLILTNHVAWYSTQALSRLRSSLAANCAALLVGKPAPGVVNADELAARGVVLPRGPSLERRRGLPESRTPWKGS